MPSGRVVGLVVGNCASNIADTGNNFADDATCGAGFANITPGVDFDTNLADNGGPTQTHALLPGSVAIDAAGVCCLATDQRGLLRWDGACDSGAFEFGAIEGDDEGDDEGNDECDDEVDDESDDGGGRRREPTIFERNWNLPSNGNVNLEPK